MTDQVVGGAIDFEKSGLLGRIINVDTSRAVVDVDDHDLLTTMARCDRWQ